MQKLIARLHLQPLPPSDAHACMPPRPSKDCLGSAVLRAELCCCRVLHALRMVDANLRFWTDRLRRGHLPRLMLLERGFICFLRELVYLWQQRLLTPRQRQHRATERVEQRVSRFSPPPPPLLLFPPTPQHMYTVPGPHPPYALHNKPPLTPRQRQQRATRRVEQRVSCLKPPTPPSPTPPHTHATRPASPLCLPPWAPQMSLQGCTDSHSRHHGTA